MKKHLLSLFALAAMVFASSCSQEEIISQSTGNEVKVTFTTELRNDVKSRTVGADTDNIDQLTFAVYDEMDRNLWQLNQTLDEDDLTPHPTDPTKKVATIDVVLVKGQTYSFAFWAQNSAYSAYTFDADKAEVTVNYNQLANKREADAFFKGITKHTVTGTFTMDVTLKRPFAQVNFLTTQDDIINARKANFFTQKSKITVKNVAKKLNVLTGEVSDFENTEVTFDYSALLENNLGEIEYTQIKDVEGDWKYLATAYFLPQEPAAVTQITASMSVVAEDPHKAPVELTASDIKAQRNYRTNIYGNLLTSNGTFNVTIDPGFGGDHNVESDEYAETYTSLATALTANVTNTEAITYNVGSTGEQQSSVSIQIPAGTAAESLTFNLDDLAAGATISVSNGTDGNYSNPVVIEVPEGIDLGNVTINLPNAHVTLKQGSYTQVTSATSGTTLEVGNGTEIATLTVNQGNVRIAEGGKVGTITNSTEGTLYVLVGGEWTNMASRDANTIVVYEDTEHTFVMDNMYSVDKVEDLISYARKVLGVSDITISLAKDATGDVTIAQEAGVKITIQGNKKAFNGVITVDGKSATYTTAGLTIKDLNFAAETISADACIRLGNGTNATRYTCNVTVSGCTFDVSGAVGVKSYTGGDKNLTITGCTATTNAHSLVQAKGIDGILVENCTVNSKNGLNFNNSTNVTVDECTVDVKGYAARFGESSGGAGAAEVYTIKNSSLKSANDDGDAVIILRGTADNSILTIEKTSISGTPDITNTATNAIVIIDGEATVDTAGGLVAALSQGADVVLANDLNDVTVNTTAPYGNYYGVALNGGVFDGNNKTLDFDLGELKDGKADNYGIMASGGTIKNVTITGVFRGIMIMNPTQDLYIDNVTIGDEDVCYAINTGEGDGTHSLYVSNSTVKGWSSYGTAIKDLTFTNCTFAQGEYYTNVFGRLVKPYVNTVFDGCEFNSKFYIDLSQLSKDGDGNVVEKNKDAKIVLKNCTVNGVKLTAENWKELIVAESDCGEGQISVELKDGSYLSASNIVDYVVIE